jgi:hypothetical protein
MKKTLFVMTAVTVLSTAAQAMPVIATTATRPACYELANSAVPAALHETERKATITCGNRPILIGVEVKILQRGGCTPVTVSAKYLCG